MAYAMTKQGSLDNCVTYEFMCDTVEDMNAIENRYRTIGSIAIVLQGTSGLEVYISGSDKQWNSLSSIGGSAADSAAGLSIHICGQNEVSNGLPNISEPDETSIYLVPAANSSSGDLYDEYVYVGDNWEKFGGGGSNIDLSSYAPKASPVFTGSISLGRASQSAIGSGSVAEGSDVVASGDYSHAEGNGELDESKTIGGITYTTGGAYGEASHAEGEWNLALGEGSHAEGFGTVASGDYSHAEGCGNLALGEGSHAEGYETVASGDYSHAEGAETVASEWASHAEGDGTTASNYCSHAEGQGATASALGSHAEGYYTVASGNYSHAEGLETTAAGGSSHVVGRYNVIDNYTLQPAEWQANTHYNVGDKVKRTMSTGDGGTVSLILTCAVSNTDQTFNQIHWGEFEEINYVEIVGNGFEEANRSNARAVDWKGNERLMGDLYVGCNADSTGGIKLPRIPSAPSTDGTYVLQATVTNGTPTYSWVSAG